MFLAGIAACLAARAQSADTVRLAFIGDVMSHHPQVTAALRAGADPAADSSYDYSDCFKYVRPFFDSADFVVANMEFPVGVRPYTGYPQFSAPPAAAYETLRSGVDLFLAANNHICDKGLAGMDSTYTIYSRMGVPFTGFYRSEGEELEKYPLTVSVKGIRIAIINFTYGTNGLPVPAPYRVSTMDTASVRAAVERAREQKADYIIAMPHWGEEYQLKQNDGTNCLHGGGTTGWMNKVYKAEQIGDSILKLTIVAEDGENGFPGTITATTTYKVTADNTLDMTWEATTDKETIINQTNHNYYNLNGDFNNVGTDMELMINADNFTPSDTLYIPTGEIKSVEGTPFDFRKAHAIADAIGADFDQIKNARGGIDHNFCLNTKGDDTKVCATLYSKKTGIFMEMFTNEPGVQCYTGNFQGVDGQLEIPHKNGKYPQYVSVCLESQKYPDSPNKKDWIQPNLKPGETYKSHAAYKFSIK